MKKLLLGIFLFFITSSVFASDKVITLKGNGWSTFSTPKILSDISFSNTTWAWLSFYTLNNWTWQSVTVWTGTIKPLEWYMVYNSNPSNINIDLTYKQWITPQEALFTKNLKAWWNLLWVTSENTPFTTIWSNATMSVDFSDTTDLLWDLLWYTNIGRTFTTFIWNLNINNMTSRYWKSYGIFMSQDWVYGWSQNLSDNPTLTITRTDLIADQSIAVGSSHQALLEYSMTADNVSDIKINFIQFKPTSESSVDNANITNFQLLINNTVLSTKNMINWVVSFDNLNLTIPKGSTVTVRVVADFSSNITAWQKFQLELLNIDARDSNSISISSINAPPNWVLYTFVTAWSATITLNSSTPTAAILTPSASEMELARYTIAAQDDDLRLTDLYIKNNGTSHLPSTIKSIGLYDTNGNKLAGGSVLGTGTVQFALWTWSFVIPKNTSNSVIIVKASFNDITDATQTNKTVQLAVGALADISTVSGTVNGARLVSATTWNEVASVTSSSAVANTHLLARSRPIVAISTSATPSTHTFTVSADVNNRITLTTLTIDLTNPSATWGTFTLYKDSENSANIICTGSIDLNWVINYTGFIPTEISAGTSKTFIFKVSPELQSAPVNSKRIFVVQNLSYNDMMNTWWDVPIFFALGYSNVWLPSVESTFTY